MTAIKRLCTWLDFPDGTLMLHVRTDEPMNYGISFRRWPGHPERTELESNNALWNVAKELVARGVELPAEWPRKLRPQ